MSEDTVLRCPDVSPGEEEVHALIREAARMGAALPRLRLLPGERMTLSGHVFSGSGHLVHCVAEAMQRGPALFQHVPVDAAALARQQARAQALSSLAHLLLSLAQRAADLSLAGQAGAVQAAMQVIGQVRAEEAQPFAPPGTAERRRLLGPALLVLAGRRQKTKAQPAAPRSAAEARPSPQRRAMAQLGAERSQARVDEVLAALSMKMKRDQ